MKSEILVFKNLPKISLNQWYSGRHWSERSRTKHNIQMLVRSVTKNKFHKPCEVDYDFEFRIRPLDASNCLGILKQLEDTLFEDDSYKVVRKISITSNKGECDKVTVTIKEIE